MTHAPPLKHGKLECSGSGLTFSSHHRADPPTIAIALGIEPLRTPSGRISKRQNIPKHPKSWWEAQVRLYGLKCTTWTVEGMKEILKVALQHGLQVPDTLSHVEQELDDQYHIADEVFQKKVADARNEKWKTLTTDVARANLDPERFLRELKSKSGAVALHGLNGRARFHQLAEKMGLVSRSTDGLEGGFGDRILIVGKTREKVGEKLCRVDADIQSQKRVLDQARQKEIDQAHKKLVQGGNDDDIRGTWNFEMPELTDNYQSGDITWEIAQHDGSSFRWASFDLIILEGVVRMNWDSKWKGKEKKFVWRGTETGEGEIQFDDSSNCGTITFVSVNECFGNWSGAYGSFEFKGKKISRESSVTNNNCKYRFDCLNGEAYERARVSRWK